MLERIVSGGQLGVDLAGWKAAKRHQIPTGGWMPRGWLTEERPFPEFEAMYGAKECPDGVTAASRYVARTRANVRDSDGTLYFTATNSPGLFATQKAAVDLGKPFLRVCTPIDWLPVHHVIRWLGEHDVRVLNVAGSRLSRDPGLGALVEDYLGRLFQELGFKQL